LSGHDGTDFINPKRLVAEPKNTHSETDQCQDRDANQK
jgi:hypothetical protein